MPINLFLTFKNYATESVKAFKKSEIGHIKID